MNIEVNLNKPAWSNEFIARTRDKFYSDAYIAIVVFVVFINLIFIASTMIPDVDYRLMAGTVVAVAMLGFSAWLTSGVSPSEFNSVYDQDTLDKIERIALVDPVVMNHLNQIKNI